MTCEHVVTMTDADGVQECLHCSWTSDSDDTTPMEVEGS